MACGDSGKLPLAEFYRLRISDIMEKVEVMV
jgi:hypothetical protein